MRLELNSQLSVAKYSGFQFHKGAIRTHKPAGQLCSVPYFNSIKVRLEHADTHNKEADTAFQFHKGAIRTFREMGIGISNDLLFQFHKGAIRTA